MYRSIITTVQRYNSILQKSISFFDKFFMRNDMKLRFLIKFRFLLTSGLNFDGKT